MEIATLIVGAVLFMFGLAISAWAWSAEDMGKISGLGSIFTIASGGASAAMGITIMGVL